MRPGACWTLLWGVLMNNWGKFTTGWDSCLNAEDQWDRSGEETSRRVRLSPLPLLTNAKKRPTHYRAADNAVHTKSHTKFNVRVSEEWRKWTRSSMMWLMERNYQARHITDYYDNKLWKKKSPSCFKWQNLMYYINSL